MKWKSWQKLVLVSSLESFRSAKPVLSNRLHNCLCIVNRNEIGSGNTNERRLAYFDCSQKLYWMRWYERSAVLAMHRHMSVRRLINSVAAAYCLHLTKTAQTIEGNWSEMKYFVEKCIKHCAYVIVYYILVLCEQYCPFVFV